MAVKKISIEMVLFSGFWAEADSFMRNLKFRFKRVVATYSCYKNLCESLVSRLKTKGVFKTNIFALAESIFVKIPFIGVQT